jgi:hypothetical protein
LSGITAEFHVVTSLFVTFDEEKICYQISHAIAIELKAENVRMSAMLLFDVLPVALLK